MLWQNEAILHDTRWEIREVKEYDPNQLAQESQDLPTPPPLLGINYFVWNHAPRAILVGMNPLRWLRLSPDEWQVSGDKIVTKGDGGYNSDDEERDDYATRFPDMPSHGSVEMWDDIRKREIRRIELKYNISWAEAAADMAEWFWKNGWEELGMIRIIPGGNPPMVSGRSPHHAVPGPDPVVSKRGSPKRRSESIKRGGDSDSARRDNSGRMASNDCELPSENGWAVLHV
jgi:hypothetical protein